MGKSKVTNISISIGGDLAEQILFERDLGKSERVYPATYSRIERLRKFANKGGYQDSIMVVNAYKVKEELRRKFCEEHGITMDELRAVL